MRSRCGGGMNGCAGVGRGRIGVGITRYVVVKLTTMDLYSQSTMCTRAGRTYEPNGIIASQRGTAYLVWCFLSRFLSRSHAFVPFGSGQFSWLVLRSCFLCTWTLPTLHLISLWLFHVLSCSSFPHPTLHLQHTTPPSTFEC